MTTTFKLMTAIIFLTGAVTLSACQKPQSEIDDSQFENMNSQTGQNDKVPSSDVKMVDQVDETTTVANPASAIDQELRMIDQEIKAIKDTDFDESGLTPEQLGVE